MSRRSRSASAVLALVGMLATSAFAGVTALHVVLEHEHSHGSEPLDPGHHPAENSSHGHHAEAPTESLTHQADASAHEHSVALATNLEHRSLRARTALVRTGHTVGTPPFALDAPSGAPARISRAGPAPRAAPLSRRSVVLQV